MSMVQARLAGLVPSAAHVSPWQPIATAPRDRPFFALNHDGEVWVARYIDGERLAFRDHKMVETRRWFTKKIDGEEWRREDTEWEQHADEWRDCWCYWTRGYEFRPTLWLELPRPPASGMDARSGETGTGSTEGDSPTAEGGDAHTPPPSERGSGD
jgi:hypothetical protein